MHGALAKNVPCTSSLGTYRIRQRQELQKGLIYLFADASPPMIITLASTPKKPIIGKPVVIFCEAVGVPLPSYAIAHNGSDLVSTFKTYVVSALKFSDGGS